MTSKNENRPALVGADRVIDINGVAAFDADDITTNEQTVQAAIIAAKYGLSPWMARLVCHLSNIGGRFV